MHILFLPASCVFPFLLCCVAVWLSLPFSYLPCSLYVYFFSSKNFFLYLFWNFLHIICKWGHSLPSFPRVNSFSCLTALPAVSLFIFQSSIILVCTPQFTHFFEPIHQALNDDLLEFCCFHTSGNCWLSWAMPFLGLISRERKQLTFGRHTKRPYFPFSPPPSPGFNPLSYHLPAFIFPEARITHLRTFENSWKVVPTSSSWTYFILRCLKPQQRLWLMVSHPTCLLPTPVLLCDPPLQRINPPLGICKFNKLKIFVLLDLFSCLFFSVFVHMYVCALQACRTHGGQKWVLDPLEIERRMLVNHHARPGNWTCVLRKSSHCS